MVNINLMVHEILYDFEASMFNRKSCEMFSFYLSNKPMMIESPSLNSFVISVVSESNVNNYLQANHNGNDRFDDYLLEPSNF